MILSREELIELTQRQRSRAQATVLRHLGIDFRTRPDGSLAVSRAAVDAAKAARPALSPFLFCTRAGAGYVNEETGDANGWDSMWQRYMDRALVETKLKQRFTEHDLRAKCASDAESLEHARALLSHADARTTQAVYRRKPERVQPLNRTSRSE